jgi:hypothetical protein
LKEEKKLVKCYIWSIAMCGAETWTLLKIEQKCVDSFEMWCWRKMEKISWTGCVRNEEVKEERSILQTKNEGRITGLVTSCVRTAFYNTLLKERQREGWK